MTISNFANTSTIIAFSGDGIEVTEASLRSLREARRIEWNHMDRNWQPAADEDGDRTANWQYVLAHAEIIGDVPDESP